MSENNRCGDCDRPECRKAATKAAYKPVQYANSCHKPLPYPEDECKRLEDEWRAAREACWANTVNWRAVALERGDALTAARSEIVLAKGEIVHLREFLAAKHLEVVELQAGITRLRGLIDVTAWQWVALPADCYGLLHKEEHRGAVSQNPIVKDGPSWMVSVAEPDRGVRFLPFQESAEDAMRALEKHYFLPKLNRFE